MSDETSNTDSASGPDFETAVQNQQYETAISKPEIVEKGGYSPPARIYDLSNLPNAPMDPLAVTNVSVPPSAGATGDAPNAPASE